LKNGLIKLIDKTLLRKHAIIESVNDQLKNICQIEHSHHHSRFSFLVNLISSLIAYSSHPKKPYLDLECKGLDTLPQPFSNVELTLSNKASVAKIIIVKTDNKFPISIEI
jgi:Transposase DDE domain